MPRRNAYKIPEAIMRPEKIQIDAGSPDRSSLASTPKWPARGYLLNNSIEAEKLEGEVEVGNFEERRESSDRT